MCDQKLFELRRSRAIGVESVSPLYAGRLNERQRYVVGGLISESQRRNKTSLRSRGEIRFPLAGAGPPVQQEGALQLMQRWQRRPA
jgi:hypothetical protein